MILQSVEQPLIKTWIPQLCEPPQDSEIGSILVKTNLDSDVEKPYYGKNYAMSFIPNPFLNSNNPQ